MKANIVLGLLGSVGTLVFLFEMLRRRRLREKYAVLWGTVAGASLVVALAPGTLRWASDLVGVQVPSNLLFFVASMVLLLTSIQHSVELGRLEEKTRTLAEEVALLRLELHEQSAGRSPDTSS
ncbi:DUF2304 domain-containing protein [Nocardioides litoris]|uniref:DUF2304 domain-containing protein n=1 Tax=Nocardioides litoris TaxID=1926648 RepID=UPI00111F5569|nr:DUF2304 domain-containing protein [Nocardioides litoris]